LEQRGGGIGRERQVTDFVEDPESWSGEEAHGGRPSAFERGAATQVPTSHLAHVELREGATGDDSSPKRGEMVRRSTPYAFHDGTVGLYFMGFCREQAPMRERMEAIYAMNGQQRDAHRLLDTGVGLLLLRTLGRSARPNAHLTGRR
jgi:deferrochelatase/peroxidase EfeB